MNPVFVVTVFFVLGCGLGLFAPLPFCVGAAGLTIGAALFFRLRGHPACLLPVACLMMLGAGWTAAPDYPAPLPGDAACVRIAEGTIVEPPWPVEETQRMSVALLRVSPCLSAPWAGPLTPATGRIFLTVHTRDPVRFQRGETVRFRALIKPLIPRRNPGIPARSGPLSYAAGLGDVRMMARVAATDWPYRHAFDVWRRQASVVFEEALSPRNAALATALSLGETRALPRDMRAHFRQTGTAHLIAVSGLHLGLTVLLVFGIVRGLLVRTRLARARDVGGIAALCTIPAAAGFAFLTGLRTPVVRAMFMCVAGLLGRGFGRSGGAVTALSLSAVVILAADPTALIQPGFQLSFSAVLGLLFVAQARAARARQTLSPAPEPGAARWWHGPGRFLRSCALATAVATAATAPLVLRHFGALPLVGLVVNLAAVPLVGFLILPLLQGALAVALLSKASAVAVASCLAPLLTLLDRSLAVVARLPGRIENPSFLASAALTLAAGGVFFFAATWRRVAIGSVLCAAVLGAVSLLAGRPEHEGKMTLRFLDVGQGDSTLVTSPEGRHLLIDAGGRAPGGFDAGEETVVPVLKALGITQLDAVVITHPDVDHAGGVGAVLDEIPAGAVWDNGQGAALEVGSGYGAALDRAARRGVPVLRTPELCGRWSLGSVRLTVIHPCDGPGGFDPRRTTNDNAIVIRAAFGHRSAIFMGDVGQAVEAALVSSNPKLRADILKLGHHGSRSSTSASLLDALEPVVAIASVGPFNRFGLPHPSIVERLGARGIRLFRTDRHGGITVVTDGRSIAVRPTLRLGQ